MRSVELLRVAAEAEVLRLKREAVSTARRTIFLIGAGIFGFAAIGFLHGAAWIWLRRAEGPLTATLGVGGLDLAIALLLLFLARGRTDPVAKEAEYIRRASLLRLRQQPPSEWLSAAIGDRGSAYMLGGIIAEQLVRIFSRRR
ncbi:hypothetical protein [Roseococcus sp. YIM B11640]|uniref:hypothetical protein n=1 Tax=Roseococcus sp. YIM B11640 TaxID=3133973 RepID=UPI003C7EBD44